MERKKKRVVEIRGVRLRVRWYGFDERGRYGMICKTWKMDEKSEAMNLRIQSVHCAECRRLRVEVLRLHGLSIVLLFRL